MVAETTLRPQMLAMKNLYSNKARESVKFLGFNITLWVLSFIFLITSGCATTPVIRQPYINRITFQPPPSEELRASFGDVLLSISISFVDEEMGNFRNNEKLSFLAIDADLLKNILSDQIINAAREVGITNLVGTATNGDSEGVELNVSLKSYAAHLQDSEASDPSIVLWMETEARLSRIIDGEKVYTNLLAYSSMPRKRSSLLKYKGLVPEQVNKGLKEVAKQIVEEIFLVGPIRDESNWGGLGAYNYCGVKPIYPENLASNRSKTVSPTLVDSLQPTLRWEIFPNERDLKSVAGPIFERVTDVQYDLRVWKITDNAFGSVAYERLGLPEPSHAFEEPLEPGVVYFWSIRPRYMLEGKLRLGRWSYSRFPWQSPRPGDRQPYPAGTSASGFLPLDLAILAGVIIYETADHYAKKARSFTGNPCKIQFIPFENYYRIETVDPNKPKQVFSEEEDY